MWVIPERHRGEEVERRGLFRKVVLCGEVHFRHSVRDGIEHPECGHQLVRIEQAHRHPAVGRGRDPPSDPDHRCADPRKVLRKRRDELQLLQPPRHGRCGDGARGGGRAGGQELTALHPTTPLSHRLSVPLRRRSVVFGLESLESMTAGNDGPGRTDDTAFRGQTMAATVHRVEDCGGRSCGDLLIDAFRARPTRRGPARPEAAMSDPFNREAGVPMPVPTPLTHATGSLMVSTPEHGATSSPQAAVTTSRAVSSGTGSRMGWRVG